METNFRVGDRIECVKRPDSGTGNFGRLGTVTEVEDGEVFVEYDNGNTGSSNRPGLYYKKVKYEGYKAGTVRKVSGPVHREGKNIMEQGLNIIKRMTMTADDRKLVKAGIKTECGLYTEFGINVLLQDLAGTAESKARLIEVADAVIAERKEQKEEAEG